MFIIILQYFFIANFTICKFIVYAINQYKHITFCMAYRRIFSKRNNIFSSKQII